MGGAAIETKPATTLAGYLDLEDNQIQTCQIIMPPSFPICGCSKNGGRHCSALSRPRKRTLARTARAVVFGSILIKRVREKCNQQISDEVGNRRKELVSFYSVPCESSQSLPNSISKPTIINNNTSGSRTSGVKCRDAELRSCYAYTCGVGFVAVSLGVTTLMQNKVIAILIALLWVYFYAWMHLGSKAGQRKRQDYGNRGEDHFEK